MDGMWIMLIGRKKSPKTKFFMLSQLTNFLGKVYLINLQTILEELSYLKYSLSKRRCFIAGFNIQKVSQVRSFIIPNKFNQLVSR